MPTSQSEADKIVEIVLEHLDPRMAQTLFGRMWKEVGQYTDNSSLKESLRMLNEGSAGIAPKADPVLSSDCRLYSALLTGLIAFHAIVIGGNVTAAAVLPFLTPWYVALPLLSFIVWVSFSRVADCPLTRLENKLRRRLGKSEIGGYISYYIVRPIYRAILRRRRQENTCQAVLSK